MPALKNQKHELFCRMIVENAKYGLSQGTSYLKAGYTSNPAAAEANASRLLKKDSIQARLDELAAPAVKRARVTVDSLIEQLDMVFAGAAGDKQWGAANASATTKAKLAGYLRDKLEIGHVGEFDDCDTVEKLMDRMIDEHGGPAGALDALDDMRRLVEERAAFHAKPVLSAPPPRTDEVGAALALLRQGKRH